VQVLFFEKHATDSATLRWPSRLQQDSLSRQSKQVGGRIGTLQQFGHPETHILGESFTATPLVMEFTIAKIAFVPARTI